MLAAGCVLEEDKSFCSDIEPLSMSKNQGLFSSFEQPIEQTKLGNLVAINCHNCYVPSAVDSQATVDLIEAAILGGTDFIELDVSFSSNNSNLAAIQHDEKADAVDFSYVVSQDSLVNALSPLFIEIKGTELTKEQARTLLLQLKAYRNRFNEFAYFTQHRMTFIRSFDFNNVLNTIQEVLKEDTFQDILPFIRLSRLTYEKEQDVMFAEVTQTAECGFDMVEINKDVGVARLSALTEYAKSLGLLVSVFTLEQTPEPYVETLLPSVDVLTVRPNRLQLEEQSHFSHYKSLISDN